MWPGLRRIRVRRRSHAVRLFVRENGAVDVYVEAAPDRFLVCPEDEQATMPREQCMEEGIESFTTVFSTRIREPTWSGGSPEPPRALGPP